jgi:hypothetical protein
MKKQIATLILSALLLPISSRAGALASIWNGEQFGIDGETLVQDADRPDEFYILPRKYKIQKKSKYNERTDSFDTVPQVVHQISDIGGVKYSIYNITLVLDEPGQMELMELDSKLQRHRPSARIRGLANVCGMSLGLPAVAPLPGPVDQNALHITYSINSTTENSCSSILPQTAFNLQIKVPLSREPEVANAMSSSVGMVLPPIELLFPYKYSDSVIVTFNAKKTIDQMATGLDLKGTWKVVSAGVSARTQDIVNRLKITGAIKMDCQNPDKRICDSFLEKAKEILSSSLVRYVPQTPVTNEGGVAQVVMGDNNKDVPTSLFKVEMAMDSRSFSDSEELKIDFSDVNYSTVKTQVQLDVSKVPKKSFKPEVRKLLGNVK